MTDTQQTRPTTIQIDTDDETDRWRYRSPNGYTTWEPTNYHFWCSGCARQNQQGDPVNPEFSYLRDGRTGELHARENIEISEYRQATD